MITFLPKLREVRAGPAAPAKGKRDVVVFVHGIFSSHLTFETLIGYFVADARFNDYDLLTYDYDWGEPLLMSGQRLRDILNARFPADYANVTLIGHSMGGLVSRFALIAGELPSVRRIVMLGTPNFGALTASQLSNLWQVAVATGGRVTPIFPRKRGLSDLTQVQTIYRRLALTEPAVKRARHVEYLTFPGLFYHSERQNIDAGERGSALPFAIGRFVGKTIAALTRSSIELAVPHDGIVEEKSVSLKQSESGRVSEKSSTIQESPKFGLTYCHAIPLSAYEDTHMQIQSDAAVADVIKGVMAAGSIGAWKGALTDDERDGFERLEIV